ncbi:MAG: cupin domain-containing protein [Cytophagales bacterium]|nr:cupin domain-containing protein [Cytophagales bacterium]
MNAQEVIDYLELQPLPVEGGYYRQTHRADEIIDKKHFKVDYDEDKAIYTAIYYLLTPDTQSALHWLPTDEIFHFYLGDPVTMLNLFETGTSELITLGQDILKGHQVQYKVPGRTWQGSYLQEGGSFALMGTTMAPGFDFSDFKAADQEALITQFPEQAELIRQLSD